MEIHNVNLWFAPLRKKIVRFIVTGCARLPEVARGLCVLLSPPGGKRVTGGATSPGIIYSKMFGVLTGRKNIHVRCLPGLFRLKVFMTMTLDMMFKKT